MLACMQVYSFPGERVADSKLCYDVFFLPGINTVNLTVTGIVRLKQNNQNKSELKQELVVCRSESLEHLKVFVFGCDPVFIKKRSSYKCFGWCCL